MEKITLTDIQAARSRIEPTVTRTPVIYTRSCSQWLGTEVCLKFENHQLTGSFKIRGALNKILSLTDQERKKGVVTASAGNHAQGVAYCAAHLKIPAQIVMPVRTPLVKVTSTQGYGAEVILEGEGYDEAYLRARELEKNGGRIFIHPFEDSKVIAGQGTIGLELMEDLKDLDSVVVPVGGGGLISGIATAVKALNPRCRIYGVVTENFDGMKLLFEKKPVKPYKGLTIADGIAVKSPSAAMLDLYISKLVDGFVAVSENEIATAMVFLLEKVKTLAEGSAAAALAGGVKLRSALGKKTCVIISGGNVDLNMMVKIVDRGLSRTGRLARVAGIVSDEPGTLERLTHIIAEQGANILDVRHDRLSPYVGLRETLIEFLLETKSAEHILDICRALEDAGVRLKESV